MSPRQRFILFLVLLAGLLGIVVLGRKDYGPPPPTHVPRLEGTQRGVRSGVSTEQGLILFRLRRDDAQDEAMARLLAAMDDASLPQAARLSAGQAYLALTRARAEELAAEDLLAAKGYPDVAVLVVGTRAYAVAATPPSSPQAALSIAYTVHEATGLPWQSVAVVPLRQAPRP